ncbi:MAG: hypothetical protein ABEJ89_03320 [Haloarculaceae archaeon]
MVYVTRGLVETLLRLASEADPESRTIALAVTSAAEIPDADLPPETPVFTHFYLPEAGGAINAVFGMDLGTPAGQTQGRFVSHPDGRLQVTRTDDLHAVVFVAVPPWDRESIAAFDRRGKRQPLTVLDAAPPEESL